MEREREREVDPVLDVFINLPIGYVHTGVSLHFNRVCILTADHRIPSTMTKRQY